MTGRVTPKPLSPTLPTTSITRIIAPSTSRFFRATTLGILMPFMRSRRRDKRARGISFESADGTSSHASCDESSPVADGVVVAQPTSLPMKLTRVLRWVMTMHGIHSGGILRSSGSPRAVHRASARSPKKENSLSATAEPVDLDSMSPTDVEDGVTHANSDNDSDNDDDDNDAPEVNLASVVLTPVPRKLAGSWMDQDDLVSPSYSSLLRDRIGLLDFDHASPESDASERQSNTPTYGTVITVSTPIGVARFDPRLCEDELTPTPGQSESWWWRTPVGGTRYDSDDLLATPTLSMATSAPTMASPEPLPLDDLHREPSASEVMLRARVRSLLGLLRSSTPTGEGDGEAKASVVPRRTVSDGAAYPSAIESVRLRRGGDTIMPITAIDRMSTYSPRPRSAHRLAAVVPELEATADAMIFAHPR